MPVFAIALFATAIAVQEHPTRLIQTVDERTGIPIVLFTDAEMFPTEWRGGDIKAGATDLDDVQIERSASLVKSAMALYPAQVLKANLKKVYVCKSIRFYGLDYGGTNSLDTLYLSNQGVAKGYTDAYLKGSFHHELSSILYRNHPSYFDEKGWNEANPIGFSYGQGGTEALRSGQASIRFDEKLAEDGFLTQYSKASLEEDLNMTVEGTFSGDASFWRIVDEHDRFKAKVKLIVAFYSKLDKAFSESFFRSIATPK